MRLTACIVGGALLCATNVVAAGPRIDLTHYSAAKYGATLSARVERLSELFLGQNYVVDPLGEGEQGVYDRDPLYRFDAFDCTTFVETVLALSHSASGADFEPTLNRIRYKGGRPDFHARNHFPDADWRPHLIEIGMLKDITAEVAGHLPVRQARARIDKRRWYAALGADRIHVPGANPGLAQRLLAQVRKEGEQFGAVESTVPYIPFKEFFERRENGYLVPSDVLARIPSGTVFNIVRTRYHQSDKVGTELSIWHQGLFVRKNGELWVRHATFLGAGMVTESRAVDFLLSEYLREINVASRDHGINFLGLVSGP